MRPKTLALLVVAAMCGLVAMLGVQQVLSKQGDAVSQKEQFQERTLKVRAFAGDLILQAKLDKRRNRSAASQFPKGKCIASVPINATMSGTGLMNPGDRVDVLVAYKPSNGNRDVSGIGMEVKTVLASLEVFALDGVTDAIMIARAGDPKAAVIKDVSLLVTNEQTRLLKLASDLSGGKLHLTLRGMNHDTPVAPKDLFDPSQAEHAMVRDSDSDRDRPQNVAPVEKAEPVTLNSAQGT